MSGRYKIIYTQLPTVAVNHGRQVEEIQVVGERPVSAKRERGPNGPPLEPGWEPFVKEAKP